MIRTEFSSFLVSNFFDICFVVVKSFYEGIIMKKRRNFSLVLVLIILTLIVIFLGYRFGLTI